MKLPKSGLGKKSARGYLDGQMLIASPSMSDDRFARTLVYICAHSPEGAMGEGIALDSRGNLYLAESIVLGVTKLVKELDPSRLVNNASGWTDNKVGDVIDIHSYPDPNCPAREESRACVLGEFGGLGLPVPDHMWKKDHWGYQAMKDQEQLTRRYESLLQHAYDLREKGLCAAVCDDERTPKNAPLLAKVIPRERCFHLNLRP